MKKFCFNYNRKKYCIDVLECRTVFQKMRGLMFRKNPVPLLFYFNRETNEPIHSLFCKKFYAVWFNDGCFVDAKLVQPWKFYVKPLGKFNLLLEIPEGVREFKVFTDEVK